jgi:hypothetical protein
VQRQEGSRPCGSTPNVVTAVSFVFPPSLVLRAETGGGCQIGKSRFNCLRVRLLHGRPATMGSQS